MSKATEKRREAIYAKMTKIDDEMRRVEKDYRKRLAEGEELLRGARKGEMSAKDYIKAARKLGRERNSILRDLSKLHAEWTDLDLKLASM